MGMETITLMAEKGGVGRTTLCLNLAGAFARLGKRVLAIDMEGQASLSKFFLGPQAVDQLPLQHTMAALFHEAIEPDPVSIIQASRFPNLWFAPASRFLKDFDLPRPFTHGLSPFALREFLREVENAFDIVLVDTPPAIQGLLGVASAVAANFVITPVEPEPFAVQAVVEVHRLVYEVQQVANPTLQHIGFCITKLGRSSLHKGTEKMLRNSYQAMVFETVVRDAVSYAEANAVRVPICEYEPKGKSALASAQSAANDIFQLAAEVEVRMGHPVKSKTSKLRRTA